MPPDPRERTSILIVDDEASVRDMLLRGMKRAGYRCRVACDAGGALASLEEQEADVVITDIVMPDMSGLALTERIKERYGSDVIVMTGFANDVQYEDVIRRGASDFVTKPLRNAELLSRLERVCRERRTERKLESSLEKSKRILNQTVHALSSALEKRDPYTSGHQQRVSRLSVLIAAGMGLGPQEIETVEVAAILHDLGKLWVPADLLSKPGKLSDTEFELIKGHPQAGYDILKDIEFDGPVAEIVLQHHERLDGSGYPRGISGAGILPGARIIAVADTVEAMTSHRPYRPAFPCERALDAIAQGTGSAFDPEVVEVCRQTVMSGRFAPWQR